MKLSFTLPQFLPQFATAPFCPSEISDTVAVPQHLSLPKKLLRFVGPGLLISVGYMDPGNWATDLEAGSRYGYGLLFIVLLSSLAGMVVQTLSARLGIASDRDLASLCREHYRPTAAKSLWILAEIAIIACDIAEVIGSALALQLLFHLPPWIGVLLTGCDTVIVLGLKGRGVRKLEAIIVALIAIIGTAFAIELILMPPNGRDLVQGLLPSFSVMRDETALYIAIGILGATVMPHNLYLHSSVVRTRQAATTTTGKREAIRFATVDVVFSLALAMVVNMAILILAASAFHGSGHVTTDIADAYRLLEPIAGPSAAIIFGVALLASGQSATFTGTIAGQVVMEGFLNLSIPCWQRWVITRTLAIIPALSGVLWLGDHAVGKLLVLSQVVLSLQLPFALYPLIRFSTARAIVGEHVPSIPVRTLAWLVFVLITTANVALVVIGP
jgi:manganese transport protein